MAKHTQTKAPRKMFRNQNLCWGKVAHNLELIQKYLQKCVVDQPVLPGVTV